MIRIDLHMCESINFAMSLWLRVCWVILVFLFGIEATLSGISSAPTGDDVWSLHMGVEARKSGEVSQPSITGVNLIDTADISHKSWEIYQMVDGGV